jgi:hypothetical protein
MHKKCISITIIAVIVIGAGMFYAGMQYGTSKAKAAQVVSRGNFGGAAGANGGQRSGGAQGGQAGQRAGGGVAGGGFVNGSVISKDNTSITVKAQDGSSKIVFFSDSTTIGKTTSGSASDLNTGQQVMINGKANSDGSVTAQNIQIRPDQPAPGQNQ